MEREDGRTRLAEREAAAGKEGEGGRRTGSQGGRGREAASISIWTGVGRGGDWGSLFYEWEAP